jgi:hypothetical protein
MAEIPAGRLTAAARALMLAGRWAAAADLLAAATPGEGEQPALTLAAAEVAVDQDFWIRTNGGASAIDAAAAALAGAEDFDLDFLRLRHDYDTELFARFEPGAPGTDPAVAARLAERAARMQESAPDSRRRAWAAFYGGLVADLFAGDAETARRRYEQARTAAEEADDDLVLSYALRHLGILAERDGDAATAREHAQRSMELRQRYGCVPHVLAQQLALAELADSDGDKAGARAVAVHVHTWAGALGPGSWLLPASAELIDEA